MRPDKPIPQHEEHNNTNKEMEEHPVQPPSNVAPKITIVLILGPCCSGKSTVGNHILSQYQVPFIEADDLLDPEQRRKQYMPDNPHDTEPEGGNLYLEQWIQDLRDTIVREFEEQSSGQPVVMVACAGIRIRTRYYIRNLLYLLPFEKVDIITWYLKPYCFQFLRADVDSTGLERLEWLAYTSVEEVLLERLARDSEVGGGAHMVTADAIPAHLAWEQEPQITEGWFYCFDTLVLEELLEQTRGNMEFLLNFDMEV